MSESFQKFIDASALSSARLLLTHATDLDALGTMLSSDQITARPCPVYRQDLVYLFYGRPSYRVNSGENTYCLPAFAPVCLIIDAAVAHDAVRILPFDSGGFERYSAAMHRRYNLDDFELVPGIDSSQRLIGAFYASPQAYYDKTPLTGLTFGPLQGRAHAYYSLISNLLAQDYDDRCSAIEIQLERSLTLTGNVRAVVLPEDTTRDPSIAAALRKWDAVPLTYKLTGRFRPVEFVAKIFELVEDFMHREGAL